MQDKTEILLQYRHIIWNIWQVYFLTVMHCAPGGWYYLPKTCWCSVSAHIRSTWVYETFNYFTCTQDI